MLFTTISLAFASVVFAATPTTLVELPSNQVLNGLIQQGQAATIDLGVIADVLGPLGCSTSQLVGINFTLVVPNILDPTAIPLASVCACVEAIPTAGATACPQCPMFSTAICSSATCGCACIGGYVASGNSCILASCPPGSTLVNGKCTLQPSAAARRSKKSLVKSF